MNSIKLSRRAKSVWGVGLTLLATSAPILAQQAQPENPASDSAETSALQEQIQQLQKRLDELETNQKQIQQTADKAATDSEQAQSAVKSRVKSKSDITVSGAIKINAYAPFNQSGPDASSKSTFRLRNGQIKLNANISPRISATAMFDLAKVGTNDKSVLQDLYLSYVLSDPAQKNNLIALDVGQYKIPLGFEPQYSTTTLPTVESSLIYRAAKWGDARDTGVQVRGKAGKFVYALGAFNGLGENQNIVDTDNNKGVAGRVSFDATKNWSVGASAAKANQDRKIVNVFTVYRASKWWLNAEFTQGDSITRDGRGYYATLGYKFTPKLEGILRYDSLDFDRHSDNNTVSEALVGLNYYLKGNNAKIQANLVRLSGASGAPSGYRNDSIQLRGAFIVGF